MHFSSLAAFATLATFTEAHSGHDLSAEIARRAAFKKASARSDLSRCSSQLEARGVEKRNLARRAHAVQKLNKKRDIDSVLATDHNSTSTGYTKNTPESTIFASKNSCVLTPEVTDGPYCECLVIFQNCVSYYTG